MKIIGISLRYSINSVTTSEKYANITGSSLKYDWLTAFTIFLHIFDYIVFLKDKYHYWFVLFSRWFNWLCGPRLLSTKQLLCKPTLPGLTRPSWPHSTKPAPLLSAHFKTLLWSNQISYWQGQYSCRPSRDLIWQQVHRNLFCPY